MLVETGGVWWSPALLFAVLSLLLLLSIEEDAMRETVRRDDEIAAADPAVPTPASLASS